MPLYDSSARPVDPVSLSKTKHQVLTYWIIRNEVTQGVPKGSAVTLRIAASVVGNQSKC